MKIEIVDDQKNNGETDVEKQRKRKKYSELEESDSLQMDLFQFMYEPNLQHSDYSQTIEHWDMMPKYVLDKSFLTGSDKNLPVISRQYDYRGKRQMIAIHPASVYNAVSDTTKYFYPRASEMIIEEVLRKLLVEGHGKLLDTNAGVRFTLYQIYEELKKHGKTRSYDQIRESLEILAYTRMDIIDPTNKRDKVIFSPLENLGLKGEQEETQSFVVFSPLVTQSIVETTFRLFNYTQVMRYSSTIAALFHKRLAHHYTQASISNSWSMLLSNIIECFGLTPSPRIKTTMETVKNALEELKTGVYPLKRNKGESDEDFQRRVDERSAKKLAGNTAKPILLDYRIEKITNPNKKVQVDDYEITLIPSPTFSAEIKKANWYESENQGKMKSEGGNKLN